MPTQAQRELSASVKALQTADFEADAKQDTSGDAIRRFRNWLAECDRQAGRWTQACPWQREGKGSLSNTVYRTVFARRYRLSRPVCAQGSDTCKCGKRHSADLFDRHDGDHGRRRPRLCEEVERPRLRVRHVAICRRKRV